MLIGWSANRVAQAQSLFETTNNEEIDFFISYDGVLHYTTTFVRQKKLRGERRWIAILASENVRAEIEGSRKQFRELDALLKESREIKEEILQIHRARPYSEIQRRQLNQRLLEFHRSQQRIEDLLLDHQKKRLKSLLVRRDLQLVGLPVALMNGSLAMEPRLTSAQTNQLKELCSQEMRSFEAWLVRVKRDYVQGVTSLLDSRQKKKLLDRVPDKFLSECIVFSVEKERIRLALELEEERDRWGTMGADQTYGLDHEGRLVAGESRFPLPVKAFHALDIEIQQRRFLSDLQLTREQLESFKESTQEYLAIEKDFFAKLHRDQKQNGGKNRNRIIESRLEVTSAFCRKAISKFEKSLNAGQKGVAKRLLDQLAVARLGCVGWLLSSVDGVSELGLTRSQLQKIEERADKELERILVDGQKREWAFERKLLGKLNAPQRQWMEKKLGRPLQSRGGQPELHLSHLRMANLQKLK